MKYFILLLGLLLSSYLTFAQGLEDVLVETYYVSDSNDATDSNGGILVEGSVTYRIFIDMAEGYELQAVYGNQNHLLRIETSTYFFNNEDRGEQTGDLINDIRLDENTVALDSWLTFSAASDAHVGVLKEIDFDGTIIGGDNNDGGSEGIVGGLLSNEDPAAGMPLTNSDGIVPGAIPSSVISVGLDLSVFGDVNAGPIFQSNGGAWSVLEGVQGPTAENQVLIAQITTDGDLEFELNIQLGTPDGGTEKYVASNPIGDETSFEKLSYPIAAVIGCTLPEACNYNPLANQDDGTCLVPTPDCSFCVGDVLELIDSDGDMVCDLLEVFGCSSDTACNFDPTVTEDDGSCVQPTPGCTACNPAGTGLILIDSDGDGICDADEIPGCLNPEACNYVPNATDEVFCIIPVPNCAECNVLGTGLTLIDTDGDGICDAEDPDSSTCLGDFDNNGSIGVGDLLLLLPSLGCTQNCLTDIDNDNQVATSDLLLFITLYGNVCEAQ